MISGTPLSQVFNRFIAVVEAEAGGDAVSSVLLLDPATQQLRHGAAPSLPDIGLPDMNGYALMQILRDKHGCRGIAVSGYRMEDDIARSNQAGFMAHLTKPVQIQKLDKALEQFSRL